jgi:polar amino acid transport system substrate-binding protein
MNKERTLPSARVTAVSILCVSRFGVAVALLASSTTAALPRSLEAIGQRGSLAVCAHPNALPYSSKRGPLAGFQIELAEVLAERLGVSLTRNWVINSFQYRRADCDVVLNAIADQAALAEIGLRVSRPYHRTGVTLAVREDSGVSSLAQLQSPRRVGVQVGSLVSMMLSKRGVETTPFVFEDEMIDALAKREIDAAAVTPAAIGWFNINHPDARVRRIAAFERDADLNWNVSVGMIKPDAKLRERVDAAIEAMLADGTIARIYARYGLELQPPE